MLDQVEENLVLVVAASLDNLDRIRSFIAETASELGADSSSISDLQLAVDEAVTNIVMHGYRNSTGEVEVELTCEADTIVVRIRDNAPVFVLSDTAAPDLNTSPLEKDTPGGYGVFLIQHMVDMAENKILDDGRNELILHKHKVSAGK
jgi:serine/threonine-protein kinase RsbW